jgi:hypothetical protein
MMRTNLMILTATLAAMAWFAGHARALSCYDLGQVERPNGACAPPQNGVIFRPVPMPQVEALPLIICNPGEIWVGGKCVGVVLATPGPGTGMIGTQSRTCPDGYALLAYPGTWTLVCARDLQAPK